MLRENKYILHIFQIFPRFFWGLEGLCCFILFSLFFFFWRDASIVFHMLLFMAEIIDKFPGKRGSQQPQRVTEGVLMYSVAQEF